MNYDLIQVNFNKIQVNSNLLKEILNLLKGLYYNYLHMKYLHIVWI